MHNVLFSTCYLHVDTCTGSFTYRYMRQIFGALFCVYIWTSTHNRLLLWGDMLCLYVWLHNMLLPFGTVLCLYVQIYLRRCFSEALYCLFIQVCMIRVYMFDTVLYLYTSMHDIVHLSRHSVVFFIQVCMIEYISPGTVLCSSYKYAWYSTSFQALCCVLYTSMHDRVHLSRHCVVFFIQVCIFQATVLSLYRAIISPCLSHEIGSTT